MVGAVLVELGECRGSSAGASEVAIPCIASRRVGSRADFLAFGRFAMARRNSLNTVVVCCSGVSVDRLQCV